MLSLKSLRRQRYLQYQGIPLQRVITPQVAYSQAYASYINYRFSSSSTYRSSLTLNIALINFSISLILLSSQVVRRVIGLFYDTQGQLYRQLKALARLFSFPLIGITQKLKSFRSIRQFICRLLRVCFLRKQVRFL